MRRQNLEEEIFPELADFRHVFGDTVRVRSVIS